MTDVKKSPKQFVECKYCKGKIQKDAAKCKHCGEWVNKDSSEDISSNVKKIEKSTYILQIALRIIVLIIALILLYYGLGDFRYAMAHPSSISFP